MKHLKLKNILILTTIIVVGLLCFGVLPVSAITALFASGKGISMASAAAAQIANETATTTIANAKAFRPVEASHRQKDYRDAPCGYAINYFRSIETMKIGSLTAKYL